MSYLTIDIYKSIDFKNSGVFISHSSKDETYKKVIAYFEENGISYIGDSQIRAGEDFQIRLRNMIKDSTGGIILLSQEAFSSPWVMYEIGMLEGMQKEITLFFDGDPQCLKSVLPEMLRKYHIETDIQKIGSIVSKFSKFGTLFKHETKEIDSKKFRNAIIDAVDSVSLRIKLDGLGHFDASQFKFGYIIVRLAMAGIVDAEIKKCPVTHEHIEESYCCLKKSLGVKCTFFNEIAVKDAVETVALNTVLYDSKIEDNIVEYSLPLHNKYGVTFKCFVDIKDKSIKSKLEEFLRDSGMQDVSYSESGENQRIYFLLPKSKGTVGSRDTAERGLSVIRTPEGIRNNYLCPGATSE